MNHSIALLNRLLVIEHRSLPSYLTQAAPWSDPLHQQTFKTLQQIAVAQQDNVKRIASYILSHHGAVEPGEFPMEFTDLNFLSLEFLLGELIARQADDIVKIERIVARLEGDPVPHEIAQETLGSERAHLESLQELAASQPV